MAASGGQVCERQLELGGGSLGGVGVARGCAPGDPSFAIGSALGQGGAESQQCPAAGAWASAHGGETQ